MGACCSNGNTGSTAETGMSEIVTSKQDEKKHDIEYKSFIDSNSKYSSPPKVTMSDLWSQDIRQRESYKSFPHSRTYKLRSDFELSTSFNFGFVNELVKLMVGNIYKTKISDPSYGTRPFDGSSKLWIGNGVDQSNNEQGIVPSAGGTKFERRLIFETLDTYPVINPIRSINGNPPAKVNIPNTQFLIGVSTRYSSRIFDNNANILSGFVIDDACGYWLFDITNLSPNTSSINVYLLLSNFHGLTTLYSGKLTRNISNGILESCTATLSAGIDSSNNNQYSSLLNISGLSYTQHLSPFNSLATYSNGNEWTLTAIFNFTKNTFSYTRKKTAHPATINFISKLSNNQNITTKLYGDDKSNKTFLLTSNIPNDYIISINCATSSNLVSIIQVTYKFDGVKTVTGKGTLNPTNKFSSDKGFNQIQVNSGSFIDKITITSASNNKIVSYGGNGGTKSPIEPENIINTLENNNLNFRAIEPDLRLIGVSGTYDNVIQQVKFTFAPVYFNDI